MADTTRPSPPALSTLSALASAALLAAALPAKLAAEERGVTLYTGTYRMGESQTIRNDVVNLDDTRFGAGKTRSVDVSKGCEAELFEKRGFSGRSVRLREKDNDLGNTPLGRDSVASIRVRCDGATYSGGSGGSVGYPGPKGGSGSTGGGSSERGSVDKPRGDASRGGSERPGVILFRDRKLKGPSERFTSDVPDLSKTSFGARRVSSLDVSPGCVVTLYELPDYQGRSTTFREKDNNLANTAVGEDTASSLRLSCAGR